MFSDKKKKTYFHLKKLLCSKNIPSDISDITLALGHFLPFPSSYAIFLKFFDSLVTMTSNGSRTNIYIIYGESKCLLLGKTVDNSSNRLKQISFSTV